MDTPKAGEVWKHYKGGRYVIVGIAKLDTRNDSRPRLIVRLERNGIAFALRPAGEGLYAHSESGMERIGALVVYRQHGTTYSIPWARPLSEWNDDIKGQPRFTLEQPQ